MSQSSKFIKKQKKLPSLQLEDYSFKWNLDTSAIDKNEYESSSENEEPETVTRKVPKKLGKKAEQQAEIRIREAEEKLLNLEKNPQSSDQFDRLLLGSPNDSQLWIKFMSFHLQNTEFEKVRNVAKRALETIDRRKEQDVLNIWIALLNFENLYGTKESLSKCLEEAVRVNDDYQVYSKMLDIYVATNKNQEAEQLISKMSKKFKHSLDCWLQCAECYFKMKELSKARFILQRGLTGLTKNEHISFVSRFAFLENKFGFPEQAQTLFEQILTSYPARVDIWSCYVDLLIKSNLVDVARQVLERACSQKLQPKKMKTLYTKRIAFEEKYGDDIAVESVKKDAQRYVNNYAKVIN